MLTAKNAKNWFADIVGADRVAKWVDESNRRSSLHENDLILSTRGTVGCCALVKSEILPANLDQDLARIEILDKNFKAEYILTYLKCRFGQDWMKRNQTGMAQQGLSLQKVRELPVPYLCEIFQNKIVALINRAHELLNLSNQSYSLASKIILDYLGIKLSAEKELYSVKSFFKSFVQSGRLDAEYYQPKYDALFEILSQFTTANLGGEHGLVTIKKSIEPGSEAYQDEGVPFVRVSDVNKYEIVDPDIKLSRTIVSDIESLYPRKNTILLSKDGSVGIAYKVQEDMKVVTSSALLHLTVKDTNRVLPDYLTLVLNSQVVQLQAERDCNGAVIQHWKPSDIEKVLIPVLDMDKQKEISDKVQESFRLRKEAKRLLDNTIKAVEMAIETDEETAIAWLSTNGVI